MYKATKKNYDDLKFTDSFIFAKVMRNEHICKSFLEILFNIKIKKIKYLVDEKNIDIAKYSKSIRLDVYVEDDNNTIFNIEMQVENNYDLPKRSRYYQDLIDLNTLEKGAKYDTLKESYIIFICLFDPFHQGNFIYTFENTCKEIPELRLNDGTSKIFINPKGPNGTISDELYNFLSYVDGQTPQGQLAKDIDSIVNNAKFNLDWRREYMSLSLLIQEEIEEASNEATKKTAKETTQFIITVLKAYQRGLSPEEITKQYNYPLDKVISIISSFEAE
jgi:predicted transposase/invertase (TIGR01784 family)